MVTQIDDTITQNYTELLDHYWCEVNDEKEDNVTTCYGYKKNICKLVLFYLTAFLTVGFLILVTHWKPKWRLLLTHSLSMLSEADNLLCIDEFGTVHVEEVFTSTLPQRNSVSLEMTYKYFYHMRLKYYLDIKSHKFVEVVGYEDNVSLYALYQIKFSSLVKRHEELSWFGKNLIDIRVKSYIMLFFEECADPFYVFQVFSCILWFSDNYYYYATAILVISITSIVLSIYQARKHLVTLRNMISSSAKVTILNKDGAEIVVSSEELIPGDVLVIPKDGTILLCDAALISGTAIVNESMLTGESVPVTKTPIPQPKYESDTCNDLYNSMKHKRHTLFCGTEVLQTRYYGNEKVLAVVVKTGFTTMKGSLIRSILHPKLVDFKFFTDALKFIGVLCIFAFVGLVYTLYMYYQHGATIGTMIKKSLDVITIAVPPALPAAMSIGTVYALQRLKKKNIFCISPSRVNISGHLNLFCFDKTGTLTEDGLDFCGIIPFYGIGSFDLQSSVNVESNNKFTIGMASCHSLTIIDGKVTGDPLDIKMFEATGWDIEEAGAMETERYGNMVPTIVHPKSNAAESICIKYLDDKSMPLEVAILKQFTFSSELQRMSVVVRELGARNMDVYVKGSPEMIASLSKKETLPENFEECLISYTKQGYRVLALAYKTLPSSVHWHKIQHFSRDQAECELEFLGLIVLKNLLKPVTTSIIKELRKARIRTVMVTGDNILTAISVARECGMVKPCNKIISISLADEDKEKYQYNVVGELENHMDVVSSNLNNCIIPDDINQNNFHLAVTGKVFAHIHRNDPDLYERLLVCGTIFARMLPDQKTQLVEGLQNIEYSVGMCGDGANDCGALKRANAGISLSETEASVASPFTSKIPNISCVVEVIKEGRCALVTSFNIFKFMALYSMIQYSSVLLLYYIGVNLGDFQYLYIDLFLIMPFAITMSRTGPSGDLVAKRPIGRLIHPFVLFSLITEVFVQTAFQVMMYFHIKSRPFYKNFDYFTARAKDKDNRVICYENTVLFTFSSYQYIFIALVFSVGRPFRKPFYTNRLYMISVFILLAMSSVLTLKPVKELADFFQLLKIDSHTYYYVFYGMVVCNVLVSLFIEHILLEMKCLQKALKCFGGKKVKYKYQQIQSQVDMDKTWHATLGL